MATAGVGKTTEAVSLQAAASLPVLPVLRAPPVLQAQPMAGRSAPVPLSTMVTDGALRTIAVVFLIQRARRAVLQVRALLRTLHTRNVLLTQQTTATAGVLKTADPAFGTMSRQTRATRMLWSLRRLSQQPP